MHRFLEVLVLYLTFDSGGWLNVVAFIPSPVFFILKLLNSCCRLKLLYPQIPVRFDAVMGPVDSLLLKQTLKENLFGPAGSWSHYNSFCLLVGLAPSRRDDDKWSCLWGIKKTLSSLWIWVWYNILWHKLHQIFFFFCYPLKKKKITLKIMWQVKLIITSEIMQMKSRLFL